MNIEICKDFSPGFIMFELEDYEILPIKKNIKRIYKNNFENTRSIKSNLAGHIDHSYVLDDCHDYTNKLFNSLSQVYFETWPGYHEIVYRTIIHNNKNIDLCLTDLWVNFQGKNQVNPIHSHTGVFSFVIWVEIPYDIEEENKLSQISNSNYLVGANFQFFYLSSMGQIIDHNIPVDKTFEKKGCFFPSCLNHQVLPFYTSNNYRISVSGNINNKL